MTAGSGAAPGVRRTVVAVALLAATLSAAGCSKLGGSDDSGTTTTPVLDAGIGQCFAAPSSDPQDIKALVADIQTVPCDQPHAREAYAMPSYKADVYPGEDALTSFADGRCAAAFADYVGVDYLDSKYFFTYLLPSPRSWEQGDSQVLCLVTTSGAPITGSVKDTKQ
ncbi:hypothetical protein BH11ACT8_BH11ACT8_15380 [soil metagenome]